MARGHRSRLQPETRWKPVLRSPRVRPSPTECPTRRGKHLGDVAPSGTGNTTSNLLIGATSVSWDLYSGGWQSQQAWTGLDNSSGFHTYRIAEAAGDLTFSLWRDGVLLGSGLGPGYNTIYPNLSINQRGLASVGSEIGYIRLTAGGYARCGRRSRRPLRYWSSASLACWPMHGGSASNLCWMIRRSGIHEGHEGR